MTYAPHSPVKPKVVVSPGEFLVGVIGLDHGHIYAMATGLLEAGAEIPLVWDSDSAKVAEFCARFPETRVAPSKETILADSSLSLIASAIVPHKRAQLGIEALASGKHFFCDKPGMLTREEIDLVRTAVEKTNKRYFIYFGERFHVEGSIYTERLIKEGKLGGIISMTLLAPHRLNKASRPAWFFNPAEGGGILTDIGSHQIEQFLTYTGATSAKVLSSSVANYANSEHPEFYDFGQCLLVNEHGVTGYVRVDWFTPDGLGAWGDGRLFIVGTKATIEVRKYLDVATSTEGDQIYLVDHEGEHHIQVHGTLGYPFFGEMIRDCLDGTEEAVGQQHTFKSMELAIEAQEKATILTRC